MAYSGCFSLGGNLDFLDFHQKRFYNINYSIVLIMSLTRIYLVGGNDK